MTGMAFTTIYQQYRTEPVVNDRLALYQLSIRGTQKSRPLLYGYTFPLSPSNLKKEFGAMSSFYDVAADPQYEGVNRIVDIYGNTPVIYTIEGTTGWKLHSNDNFQYTGIESIKQIQLLLKTYAIMNQRQMQFQSKELYPLEFYDFFMKDFWQVVPIGPQEVNQDSSRPLLARFRFRFVGVQAVSAPQTPTAPNPIDQMFKTATSTAVRSVKSFMGSVADTYSEITGAIP